MRSNLRKLVWALVGVVALVGWGPANAGAGIFADKSTCTGNNCSSQPVKGTYMFDQFGNSLPFTVDIFTLGSECVRIDVVKQEVDLRATLVCPGGHVWGDDDRDTSGSAASFRPLIKAETTTRGWCTVVISHFDGAGEPGDFVFRYGRYNSGNRNCNNPTEPVSQSVLFKAQSSKADFVNDEENVEGLDQLGGDGPSQ